MNFPQFLEALFDSGRITVKRDAEQISGDDRTTARQVLECAEQTRRLEFPGAAPALDEICALWAAEQFFRACQFTVQRDVDAPSIQAALGCECPPGSSTSSRHYSVDLVFRYLPDLHALARDVAREDPLLQILMRWAHDWPLSSVGMKDVSTPHLEALLGDAVLLRAYAERIIARRDRSRLGCPEVAEAVRSQLGMHGDLAPEIWKALS